MTHNDLQYFMGKYCDQVEVDTTVLWPCDPLLQAEIRCFQGAHYHHRMLEKQINRSEGELYAVGMRKCASARQLMAANVKVHIKAKRDEDGHIRVALPWEHVHNILHVDDLDNGL